MMTRTPHREVSARLLAHALSFVAACALAVALAPAGTRAADPSCGPPAAPPDQVSTEGMVFLRVQVLDKSGRYVSDAEAKDFRLWEDGAEQRIEFFSWAESPVSYGIAVDNSGSMRPLLDYAARAGALILEGNKPEDEAFVVRFVGRDKIETLEDFTSSREALTDALGSMYVEGGLTALIDAVYAAVERAEERRKSKPPHAGAVVLITDGEDRGSARKREQLLELLRGSGVKVFAIGLIHGLGNESGFIQRSPRARAAQLLDEIARESDGRAFYPKTAGQLAEATAEIKRGMRGHYLVGYRPTNAARDGKFRKIKIEIADTPGRPGRKALARPGYFAPKPEPPKPAPGK
jgi:Ca-activated chloride channel homolog